MSSYIYDLFLLLFNLLINMRNGALGYRELQMFWDLKRLTTDFASAKTIICYAGPDEGQCVGL